MCQVLHSSRWSWCRYRCERRDYTRQGGHGAGTGAIAGATPVKVVTVQVQVRAQVPLCSPVRVKVGVKDNQTTNTQVTVIMRDMGLRNYGEFNELVFCNEAVLWAVNENGWALLACRSV